MGYGIPWRIDGPSPQAPAYSLLASARVVEDVDSEGIERWMNGVTVYPFPTDLAEVHDACSSGTSRLKSEGGTVPLPEFSAMTVYLAETCSTEGIYGAGISKEQAQARFVARANASLTAVESTAVEREFMDGEIFGADPHLADGTGVIHGGGAVDVIEAFAWLEEQIAASGKRGMIHVTPGLATKAYAARVVEKENNLLKTVMDTIVVAGTGYVGVTQPDGAGAPGDATQSYAFATGPVEIRRSELVLTPGALAEAVDRETNSVTYRAERFYLADWDTDVQAAVLVDRNS